MNEAVEIAVYHIEGDRIGTHLFKSQPVKGDCFLLDDRLWWVYSRRWTEAGELELIVTEEEPLA